jgi:hypothetical protein
MKTLLASLLLIVTTSSGQSYLRLSGGNYNISFGFQTSDSSLKKMVFGFGISAFTNEGKKGQDYTNIYNYSSPDVYEVVRSKNASIFIIAGKPLSNGLVVMPKIGFGVVVWYHNGKTGEQLWYVRRDGGTYLLYGLEVTKSINKAIFGLGYDNFNGILLTAGIKIN